MEALFFLQKFFLELNLQNLHHHQINLQRSILVTQLLLELFKASRLYQLVLNQIQRLLLVDLGTHSDLKHSHSKIQLSEGFHFHRHKLHSLANQEDIERRIKVMLLKITHTILVSHQSPLLKKEKTLLKWREKKKMSLS